MKINKIKIATVSLLLLGTSAVIAQDKSKESNVTREMTLEREYDPSVQDANKVNTLPEVKEPVVKKMAIEYAAYSIPTNPQKEINILPSGSIMTDVKYNKRRGYLNFGGGTHLNLNGDFGYHILDTENDKLNVFFSHRSTNGDVRFINGILKDEKVKAKLNDNLGGINFSHGFENAIIKLGAKYGYSAFNYYGVPGASISSASPLVSADFDTNQVNQQIQVNAGAESKEGADVSYLAEIDYVNFNRKYGMDQFADGITENKLGANVGIGYAFGGNQRVGVLSRFDYLTYGVPKNSLGEKLYSFGNRVLGTINPYYLIEGDGWNLNLGANAMFFTGDSAKVFVSPNIAADVVIADKTVLYANALGELRSNSAWQLSQENRYVNPVMGAMPSRNWLDATLGVKSGVIPGFWFNVFAGYKGVKDDYFFVPLQHSEGFGNVSSVLSLDSKLIRGGLEMKYSYQSLFDVSLKGVYNNWTVERGTSATLASDLKAYGRPQAEFTAGLNVYPIEKLTLSMMYYLATGREMYTGGSELEKMKNINEINLSSTYNINDTFGAYLKLNNLLSQKYEMYYGYPLQSLSIMVGVNVNF